MLTDSPTPRVCGAAAVNAWSDGDSKLAAEWPTEGGWTEAALVPRDALLCSGFRQRRLLLPPTCPGFFMLMCSGTSVALTICTSEHRRRSVADASPVSSTRVTSAPSPARLSAEAGVPGVRGWL